MSLDCDNQSPPRRQVGGVHSSSDPVARYKAPSPSSTLVDIIDVYFSLVQPCNGIEYIHRGDFMRVHAEGNTPPMLLQSILLVTGRFLPSADPNDVDGGTELARLAIDLRMGIMADVDRFSTVKLAVLLNICAHEQNAGRHGSYWLLTSLVTRMAYAMSLNTETDDPAVIPAETRRRLMWASHAIDSMSAGGICEYTLTDRDTLRIALPVSERAFAFGLPVAGRHLHLVDTDPEMSMEGTDGMATRHVRMLGLRNDILSYTKYITDSASPPWEPGSRFETLCHKLVCWQSSLSPDWLFSLDTLYSLKTHPGALCHLACTHIWFDQLHCTLYRTAFPGFDESAPAEYLVRAPSPWLDKVRQGCYQRAIQAREKIRLLAKHSLYLKGGAARISGHVYESIRNQLAYIKYAHPSGEPESAKRATSQGFDDMISFAVKCSTSMGMARAPLRRTLALLERHGCTLAREYPTIGTQTRAPSPGPDQVLARLPYIRSLLRHPNSEQVPTPPRDDADSRATDAVSMNHLSFSPTASLPTLPALSPNVIDLYGIAALFPPILSPLPAAPADDFYSSMQQWTGTGHGADGMPAGIALDPWLSDLDLWTAQIPFDDPTLFDMAGDQNTGGPAL